MASSADRLVTLILRSPFHGLLDGRVMLITFKGRRTGNTYTTPLNYVRDGRDLLVISYRRRTWWRNLVVPAPVTLRLKGRDVSGFAQTAVEPAGVAAELARYIAVLPRVPRRLRVPVGPDASPNKDDLARVAEGRVITRIRLD